MFQPVPLYPLSQEIEWTCDIHERRVSAGTVLRDACQRTWTELRLGHSVLLSKQHRKKVNRSLEIKERIKKEKSRRKGEDKRKWTTGFTLRFVLIRHDALFTFV